MASYDECLLAVEDPGLFKKVRVAVLVAVDIIRQEVDTTANHTLRMAWAKRVLEDPDGEARKMMGIAVVQNRTATLPQIVGALDAAVQTAVGNAVNVLAQ